MRFHVLGLPHLPVTKDHCHCAFTQKVEKFLRMMKSLGHTCILYGAEGSEWENFVQVISKEEQARLCPQGDKNSLYTVTWNPKDEVWQLTNSRIVKAINEKASKGDFVCIIGGVCQQSVAEQVDKDVVIVTEPFIGYQGVLRLPYVFHAFESYAHMHKIYGAWNIDFDGLFYDSVVPNYFDTEDYPYCEEPTLDYLLYIGRMIQRKGINIACDVAKATGKRLICAGQGVYKYENGVAFCYDGAKYECEYVGSVNALERARLYGNAIATLIPTRYLGPFEGVNVESQMCGTPVITTDFGAFAECVDQGKSGFRCHTLQEFVDAVEQCSTLCRKSISDNARKRWSLETVRWEFQTFYDRLYGLWDGGWYKLRKQ